MSRTLFVTAVSLFVATPAAAQIAAPCPSGDYSIIRTSMIKPGGTMDGFKKAYADHAKWYADHGYPDAFSYAMVMKFDPVAHSMSVDPGMIMTVHMHSTDVPPAKHDAGWDGYVKEYESQFDDRLDDSRLHDQVNGRRGGPTAAPAMRVHAPANPPRPAPAGRYIP